MADIIVLKKVRIGYPNIITPYKGEEGKYSAKFYLEPGKHEKEIGRLKSEIADLIKKDLKGVKMSPDRICLKKGEDFGKTEFEEDKLILSANTKERPVVVGRDGKTEITDPRKVKGGNIVNAQVELWAMNSPQYGQRVCATLIAVQFVEDDGLSFSSRPKADMSAFEDYGDDEPVSASDFTDEDDDPLEF